VAIFFVAINIPTTAPRENYCNQKFLGSLKFHISSGFGSVFHTDVVINPLYFAHRIQLTPIAIHKKVHRPVDLGIAGALT